MPSKKWMSKDIRSYADGSEIQDHLIHAIRSHVWISEQKARRRARAKALERGGRCEVGDASFFFWEEEKVRDVAREMIRRNSLAIAIWLNDHHGDAPDSFQIIRARHRGEGTVGRTYFDEEEFVNLSVLTLKRKGAEVFVATFFPCPDSYEITAAGKIESYKDSARRIAEKERKRREAEAEAKVKAEADPDSEPDPEA